MSVKVGLLLPEIDPLPRFWRGVVKNISPRGLMLEILSMDPDTYSTLMAEQRYVIVYLPQPGVVDHLELKGKVVWLEYRPESKPREICCMGLLFEDLTEDGEKSLQEMIRQIIPSKSSTY